MTVPDPRERAIRDGLSPSRRIPTDGEEDRPISGRALCLSGGGYRAMLFHLGALWRLNELGELARLDRIASVSGGSLTAGALGLAWHDLEFDEHGVAGAFEELVANPVRRLAAVGIDAAAVILGLTSPGTVAEMVTDAYRRHLFGSASLQELPEQPEFVFCATSLQSGALVRFSRRQLADYRVGRLAHPDIDVAVAVAASSAFPPVLSPLVLDLAHRTLEPTDGADLTDARYRGRLVLSDGGVYDNLGLDAAWKRYDTVFVSDAGGQMAPASRVSRDWGRQFVRVVNTIDNQVRTMRKRQVIGSFTAGLRAGTYWSIRSHVADYGLADAIPFPPDQAARLASIPTRLAPLSDDLQHRLINWGYVIADTAVRRHVTPEALPPRCLPYPHADGTPDRRRVHLATAPRAI
jgi:NTE family protein